MKILTVAIVLGSMAKLALAQSGTPSAEGQAPQPAPVPEAIPVALPVAQPAAAPVVAQATPVAATPATPAEAAAAAGTTPVVVTPVVAAAPAPDAALPKTDPASVMQMQSDSEGGMMNRPAGYSVGLGFGWAIGAGAVDIEEPTLASARIRFNRGLTIEPVLDMTSHSDREDNGTEDDNDLSSSSFGASLGVRVPVKSRGRVDLVALASVDYSVASTNPEGDNNTTVSTSMGVSWGVGVEWWKSKHWSVSATVSNPLFTYTKDESEESDGMDPPTITEVEVTKTTFGVVFDPQLDLMVHLYF